MPDPCADTKLLANALYEIRVLLSPYLGSGNTAPMDLRIAAHIAYALHSDALAASEGERIDLAAALARVAAIDAILQVSEGTRLARAWGDDSDYAL